MEKKHNATECTMSYAHDIIGGKWKHHILWYLGEAEGNTMRYSALKRCIPWKISDKIFTQQLRELERDGIITREKTLEETLCVSYTLTEKGKFLMPALYYIRDWAAVFAQKFPPSSIERTMGERSGTLIRYKYAPDGDGKPFVDISFDYYNLK